MPADPWHSESGQTLVAESERDDLIPSIVSREQLNELELSGTASARIWAMSERVLRRDDHLTDRFLRELHYRMFHRVWRWAGRYRTTPRNLGWEVHRIAEGVRGALDDAQYWLAHGTYPPAEAAVRLHHRLVVVHPWSNGNGRHSRLLADIILAARNETALSWGGKSANLLKPGLIRKWYVASLQRADQGDYGDLLRFCR
jgi:Fic-DOC domain mobile mystery protein B